MLNLVGDLVQQRRATTNGLQYERPGSFWRGGSFRFAHDPTADCWDTGVHGRPFGDCWLLTQQVVELFYTRVACSLLARWIRRLLAFPVRHGYSQISSRVSHG